MSGLNFKESFCSHHRKPGRGILDFTGPIIKHHTFQCEDTPVFQLDKNIQAFPVLRNICKI